MKSLFETLNEGEVKVSKDANKVSPKDINNIVDCFKDLFEWDCLSNVQKEIVADMFRSHGNIYEQIRTFKENEKYGTEKYNLFKRAIDLCDKIHTKFNEEL